jgi:hypothetical protein
VVPYGLALGVAAVGASSFTLMSISRLLQRRVAVSVETAKRARPYHGQAATAVASGAPRARVARASCRGRIAGLHTRRYRPYRPYTPQPFGGRPGAERSRADFHVRSRPATCGCGPLTAVVGLVQTRPAYWCPRSAQPRVPHRIARHAARGQGRRAIESPSNHPDPPSRDRSAYRDGLRTISAPSNLGAWRPMRSTSRLHRLGGTGEAERRVRPIFSDRKLIATSVVLAATNMRSSIASVGPVIDDIRGDLSLSVSPKPPF